jgi:HlyD family secretion protein
MKLKTPSVKSTLLGLLVLLLLIATVFVIRRAGPLAPVRVTVSQPFEGSISPAIFGIGTVEARRSYLIGPTVAGRVARVLVDVGDNVKTGQLLAEMDPVDLDNRLLALDASVLRANSLIEAADAQTLDAAARESLATVNARRYLALGQQNFMSSGAVEAKVQEEASAQAGTRAAQSNLLAARQELIRLKAERAGLAQQRQNVRLVAAQDGTVMSRDAEPGSTVVAGQSVLKLVDASSLWVKARFDQGRSGGLATGLVAELVLRSRATAPLPGKVSRVELQGDSVTEERVAQITFDALVLGLSVGELVEVTLKLPPTSRSLLLPNAVVKRQDGKTGVWVLVDGSPKFVPVRLGQSSLDGQVQVLEGLNASDLVVTYSEKEINVKSRIQVVSSLLERSP